MLTIGKIKVDLCETHAKEISRRMGSVLMNNSSEQQTQKLNDIKQLVNDFLIVQDGGNKGRLRPVKNTSKQDIYKAVLEIQKIVEVSNRIFLK